MYIKIALFKFTDFPLIYCLNYESNVEVIGDLRTYDYIYVFKCNKKEYFQFSSFCHTSLKKVQKTNLFQSKDQCTCKAFQQKASFPQLLYKASIQIVKKAVIPAARAKNQPRRLLAYSSNQARPWQLTINKHDLFPSLRCRWHTNLHLNSNSTRVKYPTRGLQFPLA